jgi:CheY-like chemotaxis protein
VPVPAVVLLDLKPKVDGLEVLRQLKAHPVFRSVPVVVLSRSSEDGDIQAAYRLGVNSYVVKPVNFDAFVQVTAQIDLNWNRPPDVETGR